MARPKSATHDIKRDAILDIAAQCFADRSYPAASMNEIATACGTSKARLYHYYDSKEAILFDLMDRYTQRLLSLIALTTHSCLFAGVPNVCNAACCFVERYAVFE